MLDLHTHTYGFTRLGGQTVTQAILDELWNRA